MKTIERINEFKFGRIVETKEIGSHTTPSLANLVVGIFKFKSQVLTTPKGFTNGRFFSFPKRFPLRGPENPNVEIKRDKNSPLQVGKTSDFGFIYFKPETDKNHKLQTKL